ncbi:MAG: M56 family metallopeptidase, partial [Actinomycetota bacterium]|nr:M56 family metallopeptidase [Actinomycetota bacterium]
MALVLLLGGLGLLALPGAARRLGRELVPAEWARLSAGLLLGGAAVVWLAAVLFAAPTVLRALGVPHLAEACERMLGPLTPGGPVLGWSALAVVGALPLFSAVGFARARREQRHFQIEPWLGHHERFGGHDLVTLPTDELLALSVDGCPSQIVVSSGLVAAVSPSELAAVLRHEAAHLEHGHHRFLLLASAIEHGFAVVPFVRRSTRALRAALERWADEAATGGECASRAVLRNALLGVTMAIVNPAVAAFAAAETVVE